MVVYLVKAMADYDYFSYDVIAAFISYDDAVKHIEEQGGQQMIMGWDDKERPMYIIDEWEVQ